MIMQRLSTADPSKLWLDLKASGKRHVKHICLPAELTEDVTPASLRDKYVNGFLDPLRLGKSVIDEAKGNAHVYAGQFLQNPVPREGGLCHVDKIKIELVPKYPPDMKLVRFWDKAGTEGGGCYTVGLLMGMNKVDKKPYVLDVIRGQWDAGKREAIIRQTADIDGHKVTVAIEKEGGSGGKESAENTVRNLSGYRVVIDPVSRNKYDRAIPAASQMGVGNFYLRKALWNDEYIEELRAFGPLAAYMDQVDATSGAFNFLNRKRLRAGAIPLNQR